MTEPGRPDGHRDLVIEPGPLVGHRDRVTESGPPDGHRDLVTASSSLIGSANRGPHQPADVLARPALSLLLDELARRFGEGPVPVRLTVPPLDPEAQTALADLLGLDRLPANGFRLPISRLLVVLGLTSTAELRTQVELLRGPLGDRRADRADGLTRRADLWEWLADEAAGLDLGAGPGRLAGWVEAVRAAGARGGVDTHRARLQAALDVLHRLPAGGVSLASFAADVTGDPHALDHGRSVAGLVLDAVGHGLGQQRPIGAEAARELWETVGVVPDPLSSTVLALGLPGGEGDPLAQWISAARAVGEPVVLTLANLRRWPPDPLRAGARLYVVENPSILLEAAAQGWDGPPLVCSSGRPTVATVTLLRRLTGGGAVAYQHADFDPAGLSITEWLRRQAGTVPWRMTAADYLRHRPESARETVGPVPDTPWDQGLAVGMRVHGRVVYEEQVRQELLVAMRQGS